MKKLLLLFALLFAFSSCCKQELVDIDYDTICFNVYIYRLHQSGRFHSTLDPELSEIGGFDSQRFDEVYNTNGTLISYKRYACLSN